MYFTKTKCLYWSQRVKIGGSEWESNPPATSEMPPDGFEDRDDHRTTCASKPLSQRMTFHVSCATRRLHRAEGIPLRYMLVLRLVGQVPPMRARMFQWAPLYWHMWMYSYIHIFMKRRVLVKKSQIGRLKASAAESRRTHDLPAEIGTWYKPIKKPVTLRLDADVLAWFKKQGNGYQTRINQALRRVMTEERRESKG
jgi:uncharacterized protein (DUF4415 family)